MVLQPRSHVGLQLAWPSSDPGIECGGSLPSKQPKQPSRGQSTVIGHQRRGIASSGRPLKSLPWTPARRPARKNQQFGSDDPLAAQNSIQSAGSRSIGFSDFLSSATPSLSSAAGLRNAASDSTLLRKSTNTKLAPLPQQPITFEEMYALSKNRAKLRSQGESRSGSVILQAPKKLPPATPPTRHKKAPAWEEFESSPEEIAWAVSILGPAASKVKLGETVDDCVDLQTAQPSTSSEDAQLSATQPVARSSLPELVLDEEKAGILAGFAVQSKKDSLQNVPPYISNVRKSMMKSEMRKSRSSFAAINSPSKFQTTVDVQESLLPGMRANERPELLRVLEQEKDNEEDVFSDQEYERMRTTFRRFSEGGEIHVDDLVDVVVHLGYIKPTHETVRETLNEVTPYVSVDFGELVSFVERYIAYERRHFHCMFNKFDEDGGGELDIDELQNLLTSMGITPLKATLDEALEVVDADNSGMLDFDEFVHLMAVYRVTEGFTRAEVLELSRVFARFAEGAGVESDEPQIMEHQLGDALCHMFGQQARGIAVQLTEELKARAKDRKDGHVNDDGDGDLGGLMFPEFLVWARKAREAEVKEYRVQFAKFDDDGSNTIDVNELANLIRALGYMPLKVMIQEVLAKVDEDESGELDFDEFVSLMAVFRSTDGFTATEVEEFRQVFEQFDDGEDGEVACLELLDIVRHIGYAANLDEVRQYIVKVDVNASGCLDFREFVHLMRLFREEELKKVQAVYDSEKSEAFDHMCITRLKDTLKDLGYSVSAETIEEILEVVGNPLQVDFDRFVAITDLSRKAIMERRKLQAGFSDEDIQHFRMIFDGFDEDGSDAIEREELTRLLDHLHIPMQNVQDQKDMLAKLDEARKAARRAGVTEHRIGNMGSPTIKFWPLVHMIRLMSKADDAAEVDREAAACAEVQFAPKEIIGFREVFAYWAQRSDDNNSFGIYVSPSLPQQDETKSKAKAKASTMSLIGKPNGDGTEGDNSNVQWLSADGVRRVLRSLGLSLPRKEHETLETKVSSYDLDERGRMDFPDFLRLMRWILDTNFANVNMKISGHES